MTEQPRTPDAAEPHRAAEPHGAAEPQGAQPWANPMDAPPPFPNSGYGAPSAPHDPYSPPQYAAGQITPPYGRPQGGVPTSDERLWAILAHLSAPIASVVSAGWLTIVGPLVVWMLHKDKSAFVRQASAGAFNFTLTMWLVSLVGWILTITIVGAVIGIPMIIIGSLGSIVLGIVGAIKTSSGVAFTYPWQLAVLS